MRVRPTCPRRPSTSFLDVRLESGAFDGRGSLRRRLASIPGAGHTHSEQPIGWTPPTSWSNIADTSSPCWACSVRRCGCSCGPCAGSTQSFALGFRRRLLGPLFGKLERKTRRPWRSKSLPETSPRHEVEGPYRRRLSKSVQQPGRCYRRGGPVHMARLLPSWRSTGMLERLTAGAVPVGKHQDGLTQGR